MEKHDGGPAFPTEQWEDAIGFQVKVATTLGMSLRDYACIQLGVPDTDKVWLNELINTAQRMRFAGQALAGSLANPDVRFESLDGFAEAAYKMADAMLAARERSKGE